MTENMRFSTWASMALIVWTCALPVGANITPYPTTDLTMTEVDDLAARIRQAHEAQRALFDTLHMETVYVRPKALVEPENPLHLTTHLLDIAEGDRAFRQDFQIDRSGCYSQEVQGFRLNDPATGSSGRYLDRPCSASFGSSLNPRVYRTLSRAGEARVYPSEDHPTDDQFTPRTVLHALFDQRLAAALEHPCVHNIGRTAAGLIQVLYQEKAWIYHYLLDPGQDYVVVRYQQIPVEAEFATPIYEHGLSYRQTPSGFHYPARSYVKRFNQLTLLTATTLFQLNEGPIRDTLPFPLGIPIKNFACGSATPIQYRSRAVVHSYEDISETAAWTICGVLVDTHLRPVANVPVKILPPMAEEGILPGALLYHQQIQWDAITDELGRFAIDLEQCAWQMFATDDRLGVPLSYRLIFLPGDTLAFITDGIVPGEEPRQFRLATDSVPPDTASLGNPQGPQPATVGTLSPEARLVYFY